MEKQEKILRNLKQKFANARELCPGMAEEMYALTDYISIVANDALVPSGLSVCMVMVIDDLQRGRNGLNGEPLPEYLSEHRQQVLAQMAYLPQVVDAIASEEFATDFRKICQKVFGFNPQKRIFVAADTSYPEYVTVAIDWWANRVQSPKFDAGENLNLLLAAELLKYRKGYSEEDVKAFKESLAKGILLELEEYGNCSLSVDYHPCPILASAGQKMGLNDTDFPWKTKMYITEQIVEVSEGMGSERKTIWSKEINNTPDEGTPHKMHK